MDCLSVLLLSDIGAVNIGLCLDVDSVLISLVLAPRSGLSESYDKKPPNCFPEWLPHFTVFEKQEIVNAAFPVHSPAFPLPRGLNRFLKEVWCFRGRGGPPGLPREHCPPPPNGCTWLRWKRLCWGKESLRIYLYLSLSRCIVG